MPAGLSKPASISRKELLAGPALMTWPALRPLLPAHADKPLHAILQPVAVLGATSLDCPGAIRDVCELEHLGDLIGRRGIQEVLLVCKDEDRNAGKLVITEQLP